MTAYAMQGDEEKFLAAGMNGYVPKPINQETLFQTIWTHTSKERLKKIDNFLRTNQHVPKKIEAAFKDNDYNTIDEVAGDLKAEAMIINEVKIKNLAALIKKTHNPKLLNSLSQRIQEMRENQDSTDFHDTSSN